MTTPNAGEVIAVPELSRPICAVKSTLRTNSGQPSPLAGRMATPRCGRPGCHDHHTQSHAPERTPERRHAIDTNANGDEVATPENGNKEGRERCSALESGSMGAEAERKILLSRTRVYKGPAA